MTRLLISRHRPSGFHSQPSIIHSITYHCNLNPFDIIKVFNQKISLFDTLSVAFKMKAALLLAGGAALVGSAHCGGVHKMKLQKIPLAEQLAHADIVTHGKALYQKYAGQQFMGRRPEQHEDGIFKDTSIHPDAKGHPLPVSNFLNAQCEISSLTYNGSSR